MLLILASLVFIYRNREKEFLLIQFRKCMHQLRYLSLYKSLRWTEWTLSPSLFSVISTFFIINHSIKRSDIQRIPKKNVDIPISESQETFKGGIRIVLLRKKWFFESVNFISISIKCLWIPTKYIYIPKKKKTARKDFKIFCGSFDKELQWEGHYVEENIHNHSMAVVRCWQA